MNEFIHDPRDLKTKFSTRYISRNSKLELRGGSSGVQKLSNKFEKQAHVCYVRIMTV